MSRFPAIPIRDVKFDWIDDVARGLLWNVYLRFAWGLEAIRWYCSPKKRLRVQLFLPFLHIVLPHRFHMLLHRKMRNRVPPIFEVLPDRLPAHDFV